MLRRVLVILFAGAVVAGAAWLVCPGRHATWERARSATCINNTKRIIFAMWEYAADYDGHWPNSLTWPEDLMAGTPTGASSHLSPLALVCPQERRDPIIHKLYVQDRISYAMLQSRSYRPLSDPQPERLIVLYEIGKYGLSYDRHNNGMNIGHADGHAKWYSRNQMTPGVILSGVAPPPRVPSPPASAPACPRAPRA